MDENVDTLRSLPGMWEVRDELAMGFDRKGADCVVIAFGFWQGLLLWLPYL